METRVSWNPTGTRTRNRVYVNAPLYRVSMGTLHYRAAASTCTNDLPRCQNKIEASAANKHNR